METSESLLSHFHRPALPIPKMASFETVKFEMTEEERKEVTRRIECQTKRGREEALKVDTEYPINKRKTGLTSVSVLAAKDTVTEVNRKDFVAAKTRMLQIACQIDVSETNVLSPAQQLGLPLLAIANMICKRAVRDKTAVTTQDRALVHLLAVQRALGQADDTVAARVRSMPANISTAVDNMQLYANGWRAKCAAKNSALERAQSTVLTQKHQVSDLSKELANAKARIAQLEAEARVSQIEADAKAQSAATPTLVSASEWETLNTKHELLSNHHDKLRKLYRESGLFEVVGYDTEMALETRACLKLMKRNGGAEHCARMLSVQSAQKNLLYQHVLTSQALRPNDVICCTFNAPHDGDANAVMLAFGVVQGSGTADEPSNIHALSMYRDDDNDRRHYSIAPLARNFEIVTLRTLESFFDNVFDKKNITLLHKHACMTGDTTKTEVEFRNILYVHTVSAFTSLKWDKRGFFIKYQLESLSDPTTARVKSNHLADEKRKAAVEVM